MDAETLEALKGSIAKWEAIVAGTGEDQGTMNCPLCAKFHNSQKKMNVRCDGCPVFAVTGERGCGGSPYTAWAAHDDEAHDLEGIVHKGCKKCGPLAQAELDFLRSLLPSEPV
jgi:hypothetical protein